MRKLRLDLDALDVKSFATGTAPAAPARGTIRANSEPVTLTLATTVATATISYFLCEGADQPQQPEYDQPAQY